MKKLFDSKFLIISALSIITLILLIVFSFFLFNRNEAEFVKSGYIINPLSSVSEKYFFDEGTGYRENLSSMVVFNDVDDKEVKVLRDSFIHYEDGSIALLKNGAILDTDSIHDGMALFYNISSDSLIEKDGSSYVIDSLNGKINLKDFIIRISDNKYLVAGNVKLGYTGSPSLIEGEYFEIVYSEEGIVNIENKNFKYELSAEGTKIYIGDYIIDLGTKVLSYRDNDIMSITAITIDGNENVEIIPKKEEPKQSSSSSTEPSSSSSENNTPGSSSELDKSSAPDKSSSSDSEEGNSSGSQGGNGEGGGATPIKKNTPKVTLKDASIGPTNIDVIFDIENKEENENYMLQVVNAETGNTIDITAEVLEDTPISVNLLTPSTKYLLSVVNRETKEQYFQKMFKTDTFGVNLEKAYARDDSITYKLNIGSDTKINDATLTLYKFDEESGENISTGKVVRLSELPKQENKEEYLISFDGLESDSIYTAVLDNFALQSINFRDIYSKSVTSLTLKKTPNFPNENSDLMSITEGERANNFKLYMGKINDPDSAITKYTYYVYNTKNTPDTSDDELAMDPIVKDTASPITVTLGKLDNQLQGDVNYYYKVIVEYFDNEKYMEYETIDSTPFIKSDMPTITVLPLADEDYNGEIVSYNTYNQIGFKIYINDKGCNIKLPDRPGVNCSGDSVVKVIITKTDKKTGKQVTVYDELVNFNYDGDNVVSPKIVKGDLEMGTTYYINAYTIYSDSEDGALERIPHADDSSKTITTKTLASLSMEWKKPPVSNEIIEFYTKITGNSSDETMSVNDSISKITKLVFKIYNGDVRDKLDISEPIDVGYVYENIYGLFGEDYGLVTNRNVFNLSKEYLEQNNNGRLNDYYTIAVSAYYGEDGNKPIELKNNVFLYDISIIDDFPESRISVEPIKNSDVNNFFSLISSGNIVGYNIQAKIAKKVENDDRLKIKKVIYNVYDSNEQSIKFYIKDANGKIDMANPITKVEVDYDDSLSMEYQLKEYEIFMDYGIDYNQSDNIMRRGNKYYVGYYLLVENLVTGNEFTYPLADGPISKNGLYEEMAPEKYSPVMKMYVLESTGSSIKYRYSIEDPDNAIYKGTGNNSNYLYYKADGRAENFVQLDENETFIIDNLTIGDVYNVYYKLSTLKTGDLTKDITALEDPKFKNFRFDGKITSSNNNFTYKIVDQPEKNRVAIVIESGELLLDNTLQYDITLSGSNNKSYSIKKSKLSECSGVDDVLEGERCVFIEYVTLKNEGMKSNAGNTVKITVTIQAAYDTGITGYNAGRSGYGSPDNKDYFIFKQTSRRDTESKYLIISPNGNIIDNWAKSADSSSGYYQYQSRLGDVVPKIDLKRMDLSSAIEKTGIELLLNNYGYVRLVDTMGESINPRVVNVENMDCSLSDKPDGTSGCSFDFSSIIPKAAPKAVPNQDDYWVPFLSGAGFKLSLSGIDLTDFRVPSLFIEIWDDPEKVGNLKATARPTFEVSNLTDGMTSTDDIVIDGLHALDSTHGYYYYKVYAKLYASVEDSDADPQCIEKINKTTCVKYTQLYHLSNDSNQELVRMNYYSFTTRGGNKLLSSARTVLNDESLNIDYGERKITTNIDLNTYDGNYTNVRDYNLRYYMIPNADNLSCSIVASELQAEKESDYVSDIFVLRKDLVELPENVFQVSDVVDVYHDYNDQSTEEKITYGTRYKICVFADYEFYVRKDANTFEKVNEVAQLLKDGASAVRVDIANLREPSFRVIKEARLTNDGQYVIDTNVIVNDPDKVLLPELNSSSKNGVYNIYFNKADDISNMAVGTLQSFTEDGFVDINGNYSEHLFDASIVNSRYRFTDLSQSVTYELRICGSAYLNNAGLLDGSVADGNDPKDYKYHQVCTRSYSITTVDSSGIALGNVLYSVNATKVIATFMGGSNLFVKSWDYDTQSWSGEENENYINHLMYTIQNVKTGIVLSNGFDLGVQGETEHYFVYDTNTDEWQLTLRDGMENVSGDIYNIKIMLWDKKAENPVYEEENARFTDTGAQVYLADSGN